MRNPILVTLGIAVVALLGATTVFYQKYQKSSTDFTNLKTEEQETRIRYGEAINSIAAIQDSLNDIVVGDGPLKLKSGYEAEAGLTESQGDVVMARIGELKAGIERSKVRIQELDTRLKKSGIKVAGLERMVANLKKSVAEKEEVVGLLTMRADSLQGEVTGLVATVQQKDETIQQNVQNIEEKRRELGTIYYTIGTKRDLTKSGVVVAKGGMLGIGKTLKPSGQINEAVFTTLDTDYETVLRIPASKAQVLSAQPVSSYQMELVGKELELRITNPAEFRQVKHLVIVKV